MVASFDWILHARNSQEFKEKIQTSMNHLGTTEITHMDTYRLIFDGSKRYVTVTPFSETSDFFWKIIPIKISYEALDRMLNGDWENIKESDIKDVEDY